MGVPSPISVLDIFFEFPIKTAAYRKNYIMVWKHLEQLNAVNFLLSTLRAPSPHSLGFLMFPCILNPIALHPIDNFFNILLDQYISTTLTSAPNAPPRRGERILNVTSSLSSSVTNSASSWKEKSADPSIELTLTFSNRGSNFSSAS